MKIPSLCKKASVVASGRAKEDCEAWLQGRSRSLFLACRSGAWSSLTCCSLIKPSCLLKSVDELNDLISKTRLSSADLVGDALFLFKQPAEEWGFERANWQLPSMQRMVGAGRREALLLFRGVKPNTEQRGREKRAALARQQPANSSSARA